MKKREFDESVHYSIEGRKRYKRKLWLVFGIMVLILIGCAALFYFGNVVWDPDAGFTPGPEIKYPYQIALVVLGALISVGALVGTFLYCWFDIGKFYRSQLAYFKTKKFRDNKAKALDKDLGKLDKKTLKWYKKLGYLTAQDIREIKEKKEKKEKTAD